MKNLIISIVLLANISSCQGQIKNENTKTIETMDSRDQLMGRILTTNDTAQISDNSGKSILARGCDPEMGRRAAKVLPPLLGNPEMVSVYNDKDFIEQLQSKKWSVVFFAPGACRYDANNMNIPGSGGETEGWGLKEYRELVIKLQGKDIQIVETLDESQIINLLRNALKTQ